MRIAVTGSSGLIGSALVRSLRSDGHEVVRYVRREPAAGDEARWDPKRGYLDPAGLEGCAAVVHLAGAGVGDRRWSAAYKREIRDSRVLGTAAVVRALGGLDHPPGVFVSGSAVGYYGDTGDRPVDERAPAGRGSCPPSAWNGRPPPRPPQASASGPCSPVPDWSSPPDGGAWGRMFPLFRAGLGGRLGDGRQYWPYISLHDHVAALRHLIDTPQLSGPVNLTAPEPLTNREITAAMGRVLHRPTPFPVPAFALRLALGEFSQDVLQSQRVRPARLLESGFVFEHPGIDGAIRAALAGRSR
ncbi:TIGR01777 family oxidoreductase [Streptomyces goshikiensis]